MNRRECNTIYAYAVPLCLSTSWHSRKSKPCATAIMTHSLKSAWLSSPHRRRRPNAVNYHPICSAKSPKDDGEASKQWFPGLKLWFGSKEHKSISDQNGDETGATVSTNGISKETGSDHEQQADAEAQRDEINKQTQNNIKWPWQRDGNQGDATSGASSKTALRPKNDASTQLSRERKAAKEKEEQISLQQRFENVTRIIAPRFNPQTTSRMQSGPAEQEKEDNADAEQSVDESEQVQSSLASESVRELYQPPRNVTDEEQKSGEQDDKRWFRLPWKRKEIDQRGDANNVRAQIPGKERKPEITAERIDTLEKVEVAVKTSRKLPQTKSEDTQLDDKEDEHEDKVEIIREKETVYEPKVKDAEVSAPIADMTIPQQDVAEIRLIFGSETFFATETVSMPGGLIFRGNLRGEAKATIAKLEKKLYDRLGEKYTLCLAEGEEDNRPVVVVVPTSRDKRPPAPRQKVVSLIVAMMAFSTCLGRGFFAAILRANIRAVHGAHPRGYMLHALFDHPSTASISVALAIVIIMMIAQGVQRLVAMRHKTRMALPFFLPSYQLGTFGAVVQIASPTPSRSTLFDIALAGMVTMVVLSSICLIIGLRMSTTFSAVIPVPMSVVSSSVVIGYLTQQVPDGKILVDYGRSLIGLHPLAVIGANCLTIAALNLLPIRQLDGGRIIGALYGRKTSMTASRVTMLFLLLASSKTPYLIMYLAAMSFGPWSVDRPCKDEITEPNALRTLVGYLFMLLMIGILLPYPACKFFGTV
eukprot:TRINITY_DN1400_c0_g1_i1.p1 TRINITY_DN1400_c0_g1~~TRINITY_DN1400_c0_g1_i1.p1  ORF type:complete len:759 (-),score=106.61 TRINITY_DN1400_c0_g1_i1:3139-5415(-)